MGTFTGTDAAEIITPGFVSPTVIPAGAAPAPAGDPDLIDARGGNDVVEGGGGADTVFLGSGNDLFTWRRGDGNDVVDGEADFDILRLLAADLNETLTLSANLNRASLTSSPLPIGGAGTSVDLDINAIERIELATNGFDRIFVDDLRGTGISDVVIELGPDSLNEIRLRAGPSSIHFVLSGDRESVLVTGLGAGVTIEGIVATYLYVVGGDANDVFDSSALAEDVAPSSASDELHLVGGLGNDTFILGAARERIDGGSFSTIYGIQRVDYRHSTAGVAVALAQGFGLGGFAAGDTYTQINAAIGSAFNDILSGGSYLEGLGGDDQLYGGFESRLLGGAGNDFLQGASNNDLLAGGTGVDRMRGGAGDDIYHVDNAGDGVTEGLGEGTDQVRASIDYTLADNVERLTLVGGARVGNGNALANTLFGAGGADTLSGLAGDDILRGNDGRDVLLGGDGDDLLDGGVGKDTMTGGADRDVFQFRDGDFGGTRAVADVITDFDRGVNEKIQLNLVDADTVAGGNQAFAWLGTGAFTGVAGQLHYVHQGGNTYVEGDTNGDSVVDIVIALTGTIDLTAADFVL